MKNKVLNTYEVAMVSHNLESLEGALGYPVPMSLVDYEELSSHPLNLVEVEMMAYNIQSIMDSKKRRRYVNYDPNAEIGLIGRLLSLVVILPLAYAAISIIYAVLSVIFMNF